MRQKSMFETRQTDPHWAQIKARYPDHILLMRKGDVYRSYDDADIAGFDEIDYDTADATIARLCRDGHKVACMEAKS